MSKSSKVSYEELEMALAAMTAERDRLQSVLDTRPANNARLPGTYIEWSQQIYAMEMLHASVTKQ